MEPSRQQWTGRLLIRGKTPRPHSSATESAPVGLVVESPQVSFPLALSALTDLAKKSVACGAVKAGVADCGCGPSLPTPTQQEIWGRLD